MIDIFPDEAVTTKITSLRFYVQFHKVHLCRCTSTKCLVYTLFTLWIYYTEILCKCVYSMINLNRRIPHSDITKRTCDREQI